MRACSSKALAGQAPGPLTTSPSPLPLPTAPHRIFPHNQSKRCLQCCTGGVGARGGVERGGGLALALWGGARFRGTGGKPDAINRVGTKGLVVFSVLHRRRGGLALALRRADMIFWGGRAINRTRSTRSPQQFEHSF